jgi:hypothetical protein
MLKPNSKIMFLNKTSLINDYNDLESSKRSIKFLNKKYSKPITIQDQS